ncbi:TIGR03084 family metal-binding protein [Amycolatopsis pithecellobii]|uniref:TIGR03084 family protein n=1 Tax=Amycolatopsis pithecellobii TaxID=664692 RepID=A0A6N7Z518_9PSEU|nr:TIGR03084 family metal-binding protein [Amycolatopsis pithecellobii]MTD54446.1 TIGR03084 family protein [Amycolatopsis pithecellobii]
MADLGAILADLTVETQELDDIVANLSEVDWKRPTPADGWTIAHQIGHLSWTDRQLVTSLTEPEKWPAEVEKLRREGDDYLDRAAAEEAAKSPGVLLEEWRAHRGAAASALAAVPPGEKVHWYGPSMSVASMATSRLMEAWAHGQDVFDTLGLRREPTRRLWHIARLGARSRDFAFKLHSRIPPVEEFRIELVAPDRSMWTFGPEDAPQRLTGKATDFCLLVTQRRHRSDTELVATGRDVEEWLRIAQAYAGPLGHGREPKGKPQKSRR